MCCYFPTKNNQFNLISWYIHYKHLKLPAMFKSLYATNSWCLSEPTLYSTYNSKKKIWKNFLFCIQCLVVESKRRFLKTSHWLSWKQNKDGAKWKQVDQVCGYLKLIFQLDLSIRIDVHSGYLFGENILRVNDVEYLYLIDNFVMWIVRRENLSQWILQIRNSHHGCG